jgi:hypothetical protein
VETGDHWNPLDNILQVKKNGAELKSLMSKENFYYLLKIKIMKKTIILLVLSVVGTLMFNHCKTTKPIENVINSQEVTTPFQDEKFKSNKDYFRSVSSFVADNKQYSYEQARNKAFQNITTMINNITDYTSDNYAKHEDIKNKTEFVEGIQSLSTTVAKEQLRFVKEIGVKTFITKDNKYETYVALEMSVEDYFNKLKPAIDANDKLKMETDWAKYKIEHDKAIEEYNKTK